MSEELERYERYPAIADDTLIQIAKQAEARIDAVVKIKQIALKVTNANDWCDQDGKPYLEASGGEKVANVFNISWRFLDPEPKYEEEPDGHYTYTYRGEFNLAGRTIEVEGSRSSKDGFFKQNTWVNNVKTEKDVSDRDNKRDVKMAALTNLLGNGITRLLGIRNLTYEDLEKFAGIKRESVKGVKYKKPEGNKPDMREPGEKPTGNPPPPVGEKTVKEKLDEELTFYCMTDQGVDMEQYKKVLKEVTAFGDNSGIDDINHPKFSDKWAGSALGALRKKMGK